MEDLSSADRMGERLRLVLKLRGETMAAMARRLGVSYRTIQDQCAGKAKPSADHLALLRRDGVHIEFLISGEITIGNGKTKQTITKPVSLAAFLADKSTQEKIGLFVRSVFQEYARSIQDNPAISDGWAFLYKAQTFLDYLYSEIAEHLERSAATVAEFVEIGYTSERIGELVLDPAFAGIVERAVRRVAADAKVMPTGAPT